MVVRRTSTGASLPGEADQSQRGVFSSLRRVDMYKRLPSDILCGEGTLAGGMLTICTVCVFAALLFLQITSLFATTLRTDIIVDHTPGDGTFQVNVQIDFPFVSCDWLSVTVTDALGARAFNISGENLYKHPMNGPLKWMGIEHAAPSVVASRQEQYGVSTDFDHYGRKQISYEIIGEDMFERMVSVHQAGALLVNFHAPWCSHCQKFAPVFEHAAEMVRADARRQGKSRLSCGLATVDCTLAENEHLCGKLRIQAYPTVRVYRAGRLHPSKETRVSVDDMHAESESFQFEMYHGPRTAEALASFTMSLLEEIEANERDADEASGDKTRAKRKGVILGHDFDGDGLHDSKITTPGCSINGSFKISNVPGAFYFVPSSRAHTIADADMSHVIKHLSFGAHVPGRPSYIPRHLRRAYSIIPSDMGGRFAAKNAALTEFIADDERSTVFEHYMKVIPRRYVPIDEGDAMRVYEYTFNSNQFPAEKARVDDIFDYARVEDVVGKLQSGPMVKFQYDISGMEVVTREFRKNFLEWILGCCAILGGVYTCVAITESVVFAGAKQLMKRRLRKQS